MGIQVHRQLFSVGQADIEINVACVLQICDFCISDEVHECAYTAPKCIVKTRTRRARKQTVDDGFLERAIKTGVENLDTIRTEAQKKKFSEFKDREC